jgi:NADH-ubiquinone oxidoreductase chain 6
MKDLINMNLLLSALAFAAVLSGILVITAKNPVISVLFLISVFINVAGYLVLMGVAYLGLVYIIVYVGAIAILFLFVIMMLNLRLVELLDTGKAYTQNLPLGTMLGALFFFELLSVTLPSTSRGQEGSDSYLAASSLYNDSSFDSATNQFFQFPQFAAALYNKVANLLAPNLLGETSEIAQNDSNVHSADAVATFNPTTADLSFTYIGGADLQIESIGQGLYTYSTL